MDFNEITSIEELDAAIAAADSEAQPLVERGRQGEPLSSDERTQLTEILATRTAASERREVLVQEAATAQAEQDALLAQFPEVAAEGGGEGGEAAPAEGTDTETPPEGEVHLITDAAPAASATAPEVTPEAAAAQEAPVTESAPVAVAASAGGARPVAQPPARRQAAQPAVPQETSVVQGYGATATLVASASVLGHDRGSTVEFGQAEQMLYDVVGRFPEPNGGPRGDGNGPRKLEKTHIAQIQVKRGEEFTLTQDSESNERKVAAALNWKRNMANGKGALLAAGGWCSPSEILYGIPVVGETLAGMWSGPEMNAARGGVKSTTGPDWTAVYAALGFHQTEAEAIVGETKDCYEIPCPTFTETRMEVEGVCLIVPILTDAAYPELTARYMTAAPIVHAHKMNAIKLASLEAQSTIKTATDIGTTVETALRTLELRSEYIRQIYAMEIDQPLEVVLPIWVRGIMRSDLALRMGLDPRNPITDQVLEAHFKARNLAVQWVRDWQALGDNMVYPATYKALLYPAGTFLTLTKDVISLGALYDSTRLAVNTYTGMFSEEGIAVRKMSGRSEVVTLQTCSAGKVGAASLTC
jgi:hypothetical protein